MAPRAMALLVATLATGLVDRADRAELSASATGLEGVGAILAIVAGIGGVGCCCWCSGECRDDCRDSYRRSQDAHADHAVVTRMGRGRSVDLQPPRAFDPGAEVGNPVTRALSLLILELGSADIPSLKPVAKHVGAFFQAHPIEPSFAVALGPFERGDTSVVLKLDGEALSAVLEGLDDLAGKVQAAGFRRAVLAELNKVAECPFCCGERPPTQHVGCELAAQEWAQHRSGASLRAQHHHKLESAVCATCAGRLTACPFCNEKIVVQPQQVTQDELYDEAWRQLAAAMESFLEDVPGRWTNWAGHHWATALARDATETQLAPGVPTMGVTSSQRSPRREREPATGVGVQMEPPRATALP